MLFPVKERRCRHGGWVPALTARSWLGCWDCLLLLPATLRRPSCTTPCIYIASGLLHPNNCSNLTHWHAVNVIAADTDEEANYLASSFYKLASGIVTNKRKPLQPPVKNFLEQWDEYEKAPVLQMMKYTFIGSPATVKKNLQSFLDETHVV